MHSCEHKATKGWSWPNFWANVASFSLAGVLEAAKKDAVRQPGRGGEQRGGLHVARVQRGEAAGQRSQRRRLLRRLGGPAAAAAGRAYSNGGELLLKRLPMAP